MICIPKLALEIQDLLLPATVLLPRLDDMELVFPGQYWLVFLGIYHTDTEGNLGRYILLSLFWREPFFPQKGGTGPLFEGKRGHQPPFWYSQPPFCGKRSSRQTSNTDQNTNRPVKSDTGKKITDTEKTAGNTVVSPIAWGLLTESSKRICLESCFLSSASSSVMYVRTLYPGASQYIANWRSSMIKGTKTQTNHGVRCFT